MTALKKSLVSEILISLEGLNIILTFTIFGIILNLKELHIIPYILIMNVISYNK